MSLVEKRYAEALVNIAVEHNAIDAFQQDLGVAAAACAEQGEMRNFLLSPEIKAAVKQNTIKTIFSGKLRPEVVNFLLLLVEKGRIGVLPGIFKEFVRLADEKQNILHMTILTPFPLEDAQIGNITGKYGAVYGSSSVKAEVKLDKTLIGGVKVVIGDKVIDGTVAGRLKALENVLSDK